MLGVFLADDESVIREGLKTSIDWHGLGLEVVGEADNGIDAIQYIAELKPSIIITDIKMPGKNGLDVTQAAMNLNPQVKTIILTGYSDFEYARQAIKWGAYDFILKPTVFTEVIEVINRAANSIRLEEKRRDDFNRFKTEIKQNIDFYRKAFLHRLITIPQLGDRTKDNLGETLELYEMPSDGPAYLLLCKVDEFDSHRYHSEEQLRVSLLVLEHQISDFFRFKSGVYSLPVKDGLIAVIIRTDEEQTEQQLTQLCEELQVSVKNNYLPFTISIGISSLLSSLLELHKGHLEASDVLGHILYLGNESILFFDGLYRDFNVLLIPYSIFSDSCKSIIKALQIGDRESSIRHLQYLFRLFDYHKANHHTIKGICIELGVLIHLALESAKSEEVSANREKYYIQIMNCETSDKYYQLLSNLIISIADDIYRKTHTNHKKIVQKALDLIASHYMKDITLTWIAGQVYLNTSYLSRLFKNECNENFTVLLTKHRMEKAKLLLKDPSIKIYDVAGQVGIADPQYFAVLFKKHTGMSPSSYRDHFEEIF
jgi:two-component system response regulator YesN